MQVGKERRIDVKDEGITKCCNNLNDNLKKFCAVNNDNEQKSNDTYFFVP